MIRLFPLKTLIADSEKILVRIGSIAVSIMLGTGSDNLRSPTGDIASEVLVWGDMGICIVYRKSRHHIASEQKWCV